MNLTVQASTRNPCFSPQGNGATGAISQPGGTLQTISFSSTGTLTTAQSGSIVKVTTAATPFTITLPETDSEGWQYRIRLVGTTQASALTIASPSAVVAGKLVNNATGSAANSTGSICLLAPGGASNIVLKAEAATGTAVDLFCDGSLVHANGWSVSTGPFSFTGFT